MRLPDLSQNSSTAPTCTLHDGDLPSSIRRALENTGVVAWDIETSGLDRHKDRIATCQVYAPDVGVHVVRIGRAPPAELVTLLTDDKVVKLFHHALFDLGFMASLWHVVPASVRCTKVASKILEPARKEHSLKALLFDHLGIEISKAERTSNWFASTLSAQQLEYAARDVVFLPSLFHALASRLRACDKWATAVKTFEFLPVQLQLAIWGCSGVFEY